MKAPWSWTGDYLSPEVIEQWRITSQAYSGKLKAPMGSQPNPLPRILFGPFEFEQVSGDLRKFGNRIRLQGKPLQILSILLDHPGVLVSRNELQRHLWQDSTFVDFEQGLNTAVNKLRQALGDSAGHPRYIETIPGKGYRFIAPLQGSPAKAVLSLVPPPMAPQIEPTPRERQRASAPFVAGAVALVLLVIGGAFWLAARRPAPAAMPRPARFAVEAPPGFVLEAGVSRQSFALSPDGANLAFTAMDTSGTFSAFVRDFNSLELRQLPGTSLAPRSDGETPSLERRRHGRRRTQMLKKCALIAALLLVIGPASARADWLFTRDRAVLRLARRALPRGLAILTPEAWTTPLK